ncbi:ribosomal protein S18-alanine N-acetyltransferase [Chloroflexota bacterium]
MSKEHIAQVNEIDREAFPTQWPPPNYNNELQNQFAHYIVACDEDEKAEDPEVTPLPEQGQNRLTSKIRRWFNRLSGNEKTRPTRQLIAGFAGIWVLTDEAHITNIAVRERYQRRGIGELLLISVIDMAKELKADIMTLEVRASNTNAQKLYDKYGFKEVGLRPAYYIDNREDGVLMSTESIHSASFQEHLQQLKQALSSKWGSDRIFKIRSAQPGKR